MCSYYFMRLSSDVECRLSLVDAMSRIPRSLVANRVPQCCTCMQISLHPWHLDIYLPVVSHFYQLSSQAVRRKTSQAVCERLR